LALIREIRVHAFAPSFESAFVCGEGAVATRGDKSVKFALGLGGVHVLNVGFESANEIEDFAARVYKVPVA